MAAARIVLLVFCVALFAAAWSGDDPHGRETTLTAARAKAAKTYAAPRGHSPAASESCVAESWLKSFPTDVAAGEYLLVETTGRTQRVVLTAELLQSLGRDPDDRGEPIYNLTADNRSAYLIRITTPGAGSVATQRNSTTR
jgi:hypothetical protein